MATDIASGMILLYIKQQKTPCHYRISTVGHDNQGLVSSNPTTPSYPDTVAVTIQSGGEGIGGGDQVNSLVPVPKDWMNVQTSAHYMKFALANYGWPMYMFMNLFTGACKLAPHCM